MPTQEVEMNDSARLVNEIEYLRTWAQRHGFLDENDEVAESAPDSAAELADIVQGLIKVARGFIFA